MSLQTVYNRLNWDETDEVNSAWPTSRFNIPGPIAELMTAVVPGRRIGRLIFWFSDLC